MSLNGNMKTKYSILLFALSLIFFADVAQAADVSFSIRAKDVLVIQDVAVEFPLAGTTTITTTDGVQKQVSSQSVLALLVSLDERSDAFSISNLQYFPSFDSFYIKCIFITSNSQEQCDNWQYVVNNNSPSVGSDAYIASAGNTVWFFFGDPHRTVLSTSSVTKGQSFFAFAETYNYVSDTWASFFGVTLGVQKDGVEVVAVPVDEEGKAVFSLNQQGGYSVGIQEDFYFPALSLTVHPPATGGGQLAIPSQPATKLESVSRLSFDTAKALQFLESQQKENGSFGAPLFSDWAAVALGSSSEPSAAEEKLKSYLLQDPDPGSLLTDYERRAMALMALGINPAHGVPTDYVKNILDGFDGAQFGDPALVNDDVFALLVLSRAGFHADARVPKDLLFILSKQESDGSFAGSPDMTAAAIQTLSLFQNRNDDINGAIGRAKQYLKVKQGQDGGFENIYATSWVLQAISALNEVPQDWAKDDKTPLDVLASFQREDGSIGEDKDAGQRIWATAYAIPAASGLSWGAILKSFDAGMPKATGGEGPQKETSAGNAADPQEYLNLAAEVASLRKEIVELKRMVQSTRSSQQETDLLAAVTLPSQEEVVAQQKNLAASVLDAFVSFWNTVRSIF